MDQTAQDINPTPANFPTQPPSPLVPPTPEATPSPGVTPQPPSPPSPPAQQVKGRSINFLLPLIFLLVLGLGGGGGFFAYQKFIKKEEKPEKTTEEKLIKEAGIFLYYPGPIRVDCNNYWSGLWLNAGSESYQAGSDGKGNYSMTYTLQSGLGESETLDIVYTWISCWCPNAYPPSDGSHGACVENCLVFNETPVSTSDLYGSDKWQSWPTRTLQLPGKNEDAPGQEFFPLTITRTEEDCGSIQTDIYISSINGDTSCMLRPDHPSVPGYASIYFTEKECPIPPLECTGLGPQPSAPLPGQQLAFTCTASASNANINHYNFRVNNGTPVKVTTSALQAQYTFTVPQSGESFTIQCQVCASSDDSQCTAWGQAK